MMRAVQPDGASALILRSPSGVRAQFFERAARSTTSNRSPGVSASVDTQDVSSRQQTIGDRLELDGGTDHTYFEGPVVGVIEKLARNDVEPMSGERLAQIREWKAGSGSDRECDDSTHATDSILDAGKPGQNDHDEEPGTSGLDVKARPDGNPDRGDHPDRRRRRQSRDHAAPLHDRSGTDEADPGDDLRRDSRRIADALSANQADANRDVAQ